MQTAVLRTLAGVILAAVGVLPAFFLVFNAIFSDAGSAGELALAFALIVVAYLLLGAGAGYALATPHAAWWLGAPAAILVVLYTLREPGRLLLHGLALLLPLAAAYAGAAWGTRRKTAHRTG